METSVVPVGKDPTMPPGPVPQPAADPNQEDAATAEILDGLVEILQRDLEVALEDDPGQQSFDSLGIDSLSLVEFALAVEDRFSVQITDEDIRSLTNLDDVVDLIREQRTEEGTATPDVPRSEDGNGES
ncbi:acyl carrier protein [Kitasatospora sp. MBT63]|uniref:acyl carrier protein n=1 Tax=Kitasatospora sp. MBT63 TaxID=1444768 RepID=UPI0006913E27|nr:phosphopantetheine-binding protein [Kitasatospora sp. MBT63]